VMSVGLAESHEPCERRRSRREQMTKDAERRLLNHFGCASRTICSRTRGPFAWYAGPPVPHYSRKNMVHASEASVGSEVERSESPGGKKAGASLRSAPVNHANFRVLRTARSRECYRYNPVNTVTDWPTGLARAVARSVERRHCARDERAKRV